ncbi:MAG: hypothetical protein IT452_22580 [Planctomycetia bacterium]|nr:hypothetical protein [Planctomycetia bacterium]
MKSVLRAFLPALALLSLLVFGNPAAAGMVSTPVPAAGEDQGREAALALLKSRVEEGGGMTPEAQSSLERLPTGELLALSAALQAAEHAGHGHFDARVFWWTLGILVLLWWLAFDREMYHRHCH